MENKKRTSFYGRIKPYVKGFQLPFLLTVIGATVPMTVTVIGPDKLKEITNTITKGLTPMTTDMIPGIDLDEVGEIALTLATLYVISTVIDYIQSFTVATIIQRFSQRLRKAIQTKIDKAPLNYFDSHSQGDTLSRVTNGVDLLGRSLNQSLGALVTSTMPLIGSIFVMFHSSVNMTLTAVGSVLIGFVLVMVIMGSSQPLFKRQQNNLTAINGYVKEIYSGHSVVTSYNATGEASKTFKKLNTNLYKSMWQSQFLSGIMVPLMVFIGNFEYVMVYVVGAIKVINGDITMDDMVTFMTHVRILSQPLSRIAQVFTQVQSITATMSHVFEFLEENEMEDRSDKERQLSDVSGEVAFDNVFFGYSKNKTVIHDFSAVARPGQRVATVRPTGAGKTTIVSLLTKFYGIDKGRITIDGVDIRLMTHGEMHDRFSMVLQDTWLFKGTIRENSIYNQEDITNEQVITAAEAVGIHHFIMTLPEGYDTYLGNSVAFSIGQKQLLTITRALLKDSPLLILDEATSSVDTHTEELIQKTMNKLMEGRTSFVIAHRLLTIRNADLILVMKGGNIIEQNNRDDLMRQDGFYADLYNSQLEVA